jgi:hypothetical protein
LRGGGGVGGGGGGGGGGEVEFTSETNWMLRIISRVIAHHSLHVSNLIVALRAAYGAIVSIRFVLVDKTDGTARISDYCPDELANPNPGSERLGNSPQDSTCRE